MSDQNESGPVALATNEQLAILSEAISRLHFAKRHGLQYEDARDIYRVGGYPKTITFADFYGLYERDSIAGQIVDMPPETTWRAPPEVMEPDNPKDTPFTDAWAELVERLGVWRMFERADRLSRIGRYSVLLIGDGADDRSLGTPMGKMEEAGVLFLATYDEKHADIATWVTDARDARFGLPEAYRVDLSSGIAQFRGGTAVGSVTVHWSRCIHVAEGLLSDETFGRPALLRIYNDLHDLQKVSTSTGEAFWQRVAGILTANIDPESRISEADLETLDTYLKELYHELRKTFLGQGVELQRLSESEPNPGPAADLYMTKIAAGSGIPKRMLFGSETGERASTEDQKTYLGTIKERQRQHAEPMILRPFIDRLIEYGALPRPKAGKYEVVWPDLFQVPELEMAQANKLRAETAAALTPIGGDPRDLVEIDDDRNIWPIPMKPMAGDPRDQEIDEPDPAMEDEPGNGGEPLQEVA